MNPKNLHWIAYGGAGFGAFLYALFIFDVFAPDVPRAFGGQYYDIFNRYYLALLDGKLDLPMRVLRNEGHFTPDGTGYVYHGMGPLLTRLALGWAVPLDKVPLIGFSIWFWTVMGTALYHALFHQIFMRFGASHISFPNLWGVGIALCCWLVSPGILLVANRTLTHETIALSYAMTAGCIYILVRAALLGGSLRRYIIPLALFAAVTVHARPNVAVGLYLGVVIACLLLLRRYGLRAFMPLAFSGFILGLSGLGYLELNRLKFGDVATIHGSYEPGPLQYGSVFWGMEGVDSSRAQAFIEHGRFNTRRILPNLAFYLFNPPGTQLQEIAYSWFERATASLGRIRIEFAPGIVFLWLPWFMLLVGLVYRRPRLLAQEVKGDPLVAGALIVATSAVALLISSYGTHTVRYRIELWPFFIALAAFGAARFWGARALRVHPVWVCAVFIGMGVSVKAAIDYRSIHFKDFQISLDECREMADAKAFTPERIETLCKV